MTGMRVMPMTTVSGPASSDVIQVGKVLHPAVLLAARYHRMRFLCYYGRFGIGAKDRRGSIQQNREWNSFRFRGYGISDPDIKLEKKPCVAEGCLNRNVVSCIPPAA